MARARCSLAGAIHSVAVAEARCSVAAAIHKKLPHLFLLLEQCKHGGQRLLRDARLHVWWRLDGSGLAGRQDRVHDIIRKAYASDSTVVLSM